MVAIHAQLVIDASDGVRPRYETDPLDTDAPCGGRELGDYSVINTSMHIQSYNHIVY